MIFGVEGILGFRDPNILENPNRCFPEWQGNHQGFSGIIREKKNMRALSSTREQNNFEVREKKFSSGEKTPLK